MKTELEYLSPFRRYSTGNTALNAIFLYSSLLLSRTNSFERLLDSASSNFSSKWKIPDVDNYNISETKTTTETSFVPVGSVTLVLTQSENGTRITLTVSEIFDRKHIALNALFLYSSSLLLLLFFFFFPTYRSAFGIF